MVTQTLKIAIRAIISNKLRSFLTMLGIIIGVMSVVILVSIGQGTTSSITDSISSMGSNLLTAKITSEDVTITNEDITSLTEYSSIEAIAPVSTTSTTVKNGTTTYSTTIVGATPSYNQVQEVNVQSGRNLVDSDLEWRTNVAVIGTDVATELFDTWDVIGETITFSNRTFTIVGLLEEGGSSSYGSKDDVILIPLTTAQRITGDSSITQFYALVNDSSNVTKAENLMNMFLLQLIRDEDGFSVYNQSEVLSTMDDVSNTLSLMLAGIAAISLLVGGIGIMNIMLVSVTERTKEIGIRKAIGAKRIHILGQFLIEALILSVLGGLFGILFSYVGLELYNYLAEQSIIISWNVASVTILFCGILGIVFGGYPAAKASKLLPIDALRYS